MMVPMKSLTLLVFLLAPAFAQEEWLYSVSLTIKEHLGQQVLLSDGRQVEPYSDSKEKLPVGTTILLAYNNAQGAVLIDPKTKERYPLNMVRGDHPIDMSEESCLKVADTMQAMIECSANASDSWEAEMHRAYQRLLEDASEEGKRKLATAQA